MKSEAELKESYGSYTGAILDSKEKLSFVYQQQQELEAKLDRAITEAETAQLRNEMNALYAREQELNNDILYYENQGAEEVAEENEKAAQPPKPVSNGSAIREQHTKVSSTAVRASTKTMGNGSGLLNSDSVVYRNGNHEDQTDLTAKRVNQTESQVANLQNAISSTGGNSSNYINGLYESSCGSRTAIIGNPAAARMGLAAEADDAKKEIVSTRSGFNDNRNSNPFTIVNDLLAFPGKLVSKIVKTVEDVAEGTDEPKIKNGKSLFASIMTDIVAECESYTKKYSKIFSASSAEVAKTTAMSEVEKKQKQLETIMEMPDSPLKERIKKAISEGNVMAVFAKPNNEDLTKEDTFDPADYDKKLKEYIDNVIEIERSCC